MKLKVFFFKYIIYGVYEKFTLPLIFNVLT